MTPRYVLGLALAVLWTVSCVAAQRVLTVAEAIETVRAMSGRNDETVFVSPNGDRYVVLLVRGDVQRDGVWMEILSGRLDSLQGSKPRSVANLFTRAVGASEGLASAGGVSSLLMPGKNHPMWIDDERIALRWEDARGKSQVISVQVETGTVEYLTSHSEDVQSFTVGPGGVLIYQGRAGFSLARDRSERLLDEGFSVKSTDATLLLGGIVDDIAPYDYHSFAHFIYAPGRTPDRRVAMREGRLPNTYGSEQGAGRSVLSSRFSPDGRLAVIDGSPAHVSRDWYQYQDVTLQRMLAEYEVNPRDLYARHVQQLFLLDLERAEAAPLWHAPASNAGKYRLRLIAWSPSGQSVLLGPTFLPAGTTDTAGLAGRAFAEVDVGTGRYRTVEVPVDAAEVARIGWSTNDLLELTSVDGKRFALTRDREGWGNVREQAFGQFINDTGFAPGSMSRSRFPIKIELRQSMQVPPALYAVELATGRSHLLWKLNPRIESDVTLGRVEVIHWTGAEGTKRRGRLYYPVGYSVGRKYPLVVQTNGFAHESEFSLYGPGGGTGLGPAVLPVNLAQLIAARDIAVLQVGSEIASSGDDTAQVSDRWAVELATAIRYLVRLGLVDPDKVGLQGFSSTGRHVERALAFSEFPYAAAIISDHADVNYVQAAVYGWPKWQMDWHGAPPFGSGVEEWLENSPALNADKIHTPLQFSVTDSIGGFGTLLWPWEMFSRLRTLGKPVEYYVMPDIRRGSHNPQNPRQLMALQNRVLDWWSFWLRGEEGPDMRKSQQYAEWRSLRRLHELDKGRITHGTRSHGTCAGDLTFDLF